MTAPNLTEAVNDFILKYAPGVIQDHLYRGYYNRATLPQEQDFTIIALASTQRVGTNVSDYAQAANDEIMTKALRQYVFDIDFCSSDQEIAHERAVTIETLGRSYIAVDFFDEWGIGFDYTSDVAYLPYIDLTEQYLHRYRVSLYLTVWDEVRAAQQYAVNVEINRVENIDSHHKR